MKRRIGLLLVAVAACAALGCAKKPKVWSPPPMDLHALGTLGLVEFDSGLGYGPTATHQFLAKMHGAQPGVPVLELGPMAPLLKSVEQPVLGPDAVRAIAERYGVDVLVVGVLDIQEPQPGFSIESFTEANATADILGTLEVRFLDGQSGATLWSSQAAGKRTVARVNLAVGHTPGLQAVDPKGEHAPLLAWLVGRTTSDFRGRWVTAPD